MNCKPVTQVRNAQRGSVAIALMLTSLLAVGCGEAAPERVAVRGKVQINDQPLKSGRIVFTPKEPTVGPATSAHIVDGVYEIDDVSGVVVGKNRVEIKADLDLGFPIDDDVAYAERGGAPLPANPVPSKYNTATMLSAQATSGGTNEFDFALTSEKPAVAPVEQPEQLNF